MSGFNESGNQMRFYAGPVKDSLYKKLLRETSRRNQNFNSFDDFQQRLRRGDFVLLKNRYRLQTLGIYRGQSPRILATYYTPKDSWGVAGLGAFAVASDMTTAEISSFWEGVRSYTKGIGKVLAPFHGHYYLGFSFPELGVDTRRIGFATTAENSSLRQLFEPIQKNIFRRFYSFETEMTAHLIQELKRELSDMPKTYHVRNFSRLHARRDLNIMNALVNRCFTEHFGFQALSDDENWDIMRWAVPLFESGTFLFLMDGPKEIGFAFGTLDYNQVLGTRSDLVNMASLILKRSQVRRARLVHIGLLPEYRGKRLVKFLRHQLLLNLVDKGASSIESSYIDEGNQASIGNVKSTGGQELNRFSLFDINERSESFDTLFSGKD